MAIPRKPISKREIQSNISSLQAQASKAVANITALDRDVNGNESANTLETVKKERNRRLAICDFIIVADCPATEACKAAYAVYRQALRDLPNAVDFDPTNFEWPTEPDYEIE